MTKAFDPLSCIPSADAVRRRLVAVKEEARRLDILLRTAEQIEFDDRHDSQVQGEGVDDVQ